MKVFAFSVPGYNNISAPATVPTGGLEAGGTGQSIIQTGIKIFLIVAVILAVFFVMYGGIQWITSQGDKTKIAAARAKITYAIVGLIVSLLAFFIINIIDGVLNIGNLAQ